MGPHASGDDSMLQDILRRNEKPRYWDDGVEYETSFAKIELSPKSSEYKKAKKKHANNDSIAKIYRIQHPYALANYFVRSKHHRVTDGKSKARYKKNKIPVNVDIDYVLKTNCDKRTFQECVLVKSGKKEEWIYQDSHARTAYIVVTRCYCSCHEIIYPRYLIEYKSDNNGHCRPLKPAAKPTKNVRQPLVQPVKPMNAVHRPPVQAVKPMNDVRQPCVQAVKPRNDVRQPAAQAVKPRNDVRQPLVQAVKPMNDVRQPCVQAVKPRNDVHQPAPQAVKPKNDVRQPPVQAVKPRNDIRSDQTVKTMNNVLQPSVQAVKPRNDVHQPSVQAVRPASNVLRPFNQDINTRSDLYRPSYQADDYSYNYYHRPSPRTADNGSWIPYKTLVFCFGAYMLWRTFRSTK